MDKKRGFTLIELLVVIAIIGILSGVVLASLNTARLKARNAQRISDARQVSLALEFYFDDQATGRYPTGGPQDWTAASAQALFGANWATYLPQIPEEPVAGRTPVYRYASVAPSTTYCFGVSLEGAGVPPDNHNTACATMLGAGITYAVAP